MPFKPFSCLKTICFKYGLLIRYLSINQRSFLYFLVKKMILIFQFMSLPNGIRRIFPILDISFFFVRKSQHLTVQSNIVNYKKDYIFTCFCAVGFFKIQKSKVCLEFNIFSKTSTRFINYICLMFRKLVSFSNRLLGLFVLRMVYWNASLLWGFGIKQLNDMIAMHSVNSVFR